MLFCRPLSALCLHHVSLCPLASPPTSNTLRDPEARPPVIEKQRVRETESSQGLSYPFPSALPVPAQGPWHH